MQFLGPNDSHLAVATNSEHLKVFEVATWNCQLCSGHTDIILGVTVHKKRNLLATCSKVDLKELRILHFYIVSDLKFAVKRQMFKLLCEY